MKKEKKWAPYDPLKHGVSATMLQTYLTCKQMARLRIHGLTPLVAPSPRAFGLLGHKVLEQVADKSETRKPQMSLVKSVVRTVCAKFAREEGGRWKAEDVQEHELQTAYLEALMPAYYSYWSRYLQAGVIEGPFSVDFRTLSNVRVRLTGRIDFTFKQQGKMWIEDHKFRGHISEEEVSDMLFRDFQMNFYCLAKAINTGKTPGGVIYNIIRRPQLRMKKKENFTQFVARIFEDVEERPEHYFKRFELPIDRGDLQQFHEELKDLVDEFLNWCASTYPRRLYGMPCKTHFGKCDYVQWCYFKNQVRFRWAHGRPQKGAKIWSV